MPEGLGNAANLNFIAAPAFGVRLFGVLRFVIQPLALVLGRQPMNAKPQNIEQANFEG